MLKQRVGFFSMVLRSIFAHSRMIRRASLFNIFVAHFLANIFLSKDLANFLKTVRIFRGNFGCHIDATSHQIRDVHRTIFPISWVRVDAISESKYKRVWKQPTIQCRWFGNTNLCWFGKNNFCWSWTRLSCQRPMFRLMTWFHIWYRFP